MRRLIIWLTAGALGALPLVPGCSLDPQPEDPSLDTGGVLSGEPNAEQSGGANTGTGFNEAPEADGAARSKDAGADAAADAAAEEPNP